MGFFFKLKEINLKRSPVFEFAGGNIDLLLNVNIWGSLLNRTAPCLILKDK